MPDERPDFIPHPQDAGARPDFIPHAATSASSTTPSTTARTDIGTQEPTEVAARHARGTDPRNIMWASKFPLAAQESSEGIERGPMAAISNLVSGGIDFAKAILFPKGNTEIQRLADIARNVIQKPAQAEAEKAEQTTGMESAGHTLASWVPILGPMAAQTGEQLGRRDIGGAAVTGAATLGAGDLMRELQPHVDIAAKLLDRQVALNKGRVGLVNDMRKSAQRLESAVVGETGEVGKHAQAVIAADKLDLQRTQSEGKVSTVGATQAAQAVMDKTKLGGVAGGYAANMPLDAAKALITQLGREGSKLERTGKAPEAASVWAEYDALRKATQERADTLGTDMGKSWKHYINEFHNFIQLKKGVFGDILEDPNHVGVLDKLTGGKISAQIPEIKQWMKKYGINSDSIDYAVKQGAKLNELTQQSSNLFMGKIKAFIRHPMTAGPAAIAAGLASSGLGVPVVSHMIIPMIVAGKVAGLLDDMAVKSLLKEIHERVGAAAERVTPEPEGPQPLPQPTAGGPTPMPADYSGPERRSPTEEDWTEFERRAPARAATPQTPEEAAGVKERAETTAAEESLSKGALAGKLQAARSVYKGKRGGTK